jgi:N-methylhydantoinase B
MSLTHDRGAAVHVEPVAVELAVVHSRLESVVRAMLNTLLRSARTGVLGVAHDFSCCVLTADDELLAWAESIPIHTLRGPDLMAKEMKRLHPGFRRGDAFLNNSPYHGCSHAADWSILVPVMDDEGVHRFTVMAKAHQGDCGNAQPTTYSVHPRDVYEEGALIFPCVKAQSDYLDNEDLIRMCQVRIRVPEQWWGDYLALIGSARIGERRLLELLDELGAPRLEAYRRRWFDYSERALADTLTALPSRSATIMTAHDPIPAAPGGIPLKVTVSVDGTAGRVTVDLRENPDCLPCGLNLSEACALSAAMCGVFIWVGHHVPCNAGAFRRVEVLLREGCVVGIPRHPYSCSSATTDLTDRVGNGVLRALSELYPGMGMAEFGPQQPVAGAVLSGIDPRTGGPFVNQLCLAVTAGAGGAHADGWLTAYNISSGGMLFKDSVEIDELKHPIRVLEQRVLPDSEGPGLHRGSPAARVTLEPADTKIEAIWNCDGCLTPARGVLGGGDGQPAAQALRRPDGGLEPLPGFHRMTLEPGDVVVSSCTSGGGWGPPTERDPQRVAHDVEEGYVTVTRAREVYAVALDEARRVDLAGTAALRSAV